MEILNVLCIAINVLIVFIFRGISAEQPSGYHGCYMDKLGKTIRDAIDYKKLGQYATGTTCKNHCRSENLRYAGIKKNKVGVLCYCGNVISSNIKSAECKQKCKGSTDEYCGEAGKIILYDTLYQSDNGSTAVYILIPITIAAGIVAVAIFIIRRRRRAKRVLKNTSQGFKSTPRDISDTNGTGIVNSTYNADHIYSTASDQTYTYAKAPRGIQITVDNRIPIKSSPTNNNARDTNTDEYMEIPCEGMQKTDIGAIWSSATNTGRARQTVEHQYGHLKAQSKSEEAKCSGYSHIEVSEPKQNFEMADMTYSHVVNEEKPVSSRYVENNTYNRLQNMPHSHMVDKKKDYICDEETDYDHARAGGQNPKINSIDEYSRLKTTKAKH